MKMMELAVPRFPWTTVLGVTAGPVLISIGVLLASAGLSVPAGEVVAVVVSLLAIAAGTFVSEDLTCITVGLLIREGRVSWLVGLAGCYLGILAGDLALWLLGRVLGRPALEWRWLQRRLPASQVTRLAAWFERRGGAAVIAARFLPGTRLPLYFAAGMVGRSAGRFLLWAAIAGLLWTPLLVLTVAAFGDAVVAPLTHLFGQGWLPLLLGVVVLYLLCRGVLLLGTPIGRAKLRVAISRLWRWEFWPSWLFYLPLLPWWIYLSIRYRGIAVWTAANPGIPQGGVVGESKCDILRQLPPEWIVPTILASAGDVGSRLKRLRREVERNQWSFPLVLKPDASQRGAGFKLARDWVDVEKYLQQQPAAVVAQMYHPGPYEAGIFYYRLPGDALGRIFSITDKVFPRLIGDGYSTVEELIWRHPRYRMQARTFLARHEGEAERVLTDGEECRLAVAGNHCQGTMFRDGADLITPELERTVDAIARHFPGFFIGRFDVRYADPEEFKAGRDLAIVELNGVTSESTNIYDPSRSLLSAYRTLYRQWELMYRIGAANRARGHRPASAWELLTQVVSYYSQRKIEPLAD